MGDHNHALELGSTPQYDWLAVVSEHQILGTNTAVNVGIGVPTTGTEWLGVAATLAGPQPAVAASNSPQPYQIFFGDGSNRFSVVDNGPTTGSSSPGGESEQSGAIAQGTNVFANGPVPDCVNTAQEFVTTSLDSNLTIKWKNPA